VAAGESLWTIAEDHLAETASGGAGEPTTDQVTAYWERVKDANQNRLRSGDPDLIEPGETIALPPVPSPPAGPAPKPGRGTTQQVAPGDSLWTIAGNHLARTTGGGAGEPTTDQVTAYWERVKDANRGRLRSGDPDLIEPGETIVLPPVE
jgi:nucleoid-associated protein YgaU